MTQRLEIHISAITTERAFMFCIDRCAFRLTQPTQRQTNCARSTLMEMSMLLLWLLPLMLLLLLLFYRSPGIGIARPILHDCDRNLLMAKPRMCSVDEMWAVWKGRHVDIQQIVHQSCHPVVWTIICAILPASVSNRPSTMAAWRPLSPPTRRVSFTTFSTS